MKIAKFAYKANNIKDLQELVDDGLCQCDKFKIVGKLELNDKEFNDLCKDFVSDREYLLVNKDKMYYDDKYNCLLIFNKNKDFGLLVESEGFSYPRYAAIIKMSEVK